ncbi:MAG: hypothetical protein ABL877_10970 [Thiobacillus sp.]
MTTKSKLTALDFVEHESIAGLRYLIDLCEADQVSGIVFAVKLKHTRKRRHLYGTTGRLAANPDEAVSLAAIMLGHATRHAIESEE